jgi:diguanylate cyclase (GGDEF)-like protein/PAS domain S-box-containing protein
MIISDPALEELSHYRQALDASEARFRNLITSNVDGMIVIDASGAVRFANPAAEALFARSASELVGAPFGFPIIADETSEIEIVRGDGAVLLAEMRVVETEWEGNGALLASLRDCTARKQAEARLRLLESVAVNAHDAAMIVEMRPPALGGPFIVFVNAAFGRITGYEPGEALGGRPDLLYGPQTDKALLDKLQLAVGERTGATVELVNYRRDGSSYWAEVSVVPLLDEVNRVTHVVSLHREITERKRAEEQLRRDALYDSLTNLPNRSLFLERLSRAIARGRRRKADGFAVFFLDCDRFKNVNDSLGHLAGDQLLIAIARRIELCLRPSDTVARLGGDEFAILLDPLAAPEDANGVADRIHAQFRAPFTVGEHEIFVSASIGIALSDQRYQRPEELLRDADAAMYQAKRRGRAHHAIFDTSMHANAMLLLQMESDLRRALERNEFVVHYQPIVALQTGRIVALEALVRWAHPLQGLVTPSDFIPVAEETGLIVPLSWWVLGEACHQMRCWQERFPSNPPLAINVNISGRHVAQPDLAEHVSALLLASEVAAGSLRLEITESAIIENPEKAALMLQRLSDQQVQLCIDDFGTGYASLSSLHHFPIRTLKIDRSFVQRIDESCEHREIVRTIVGLAKGLAMDVVAEGVETEAQLEQLRALECTYGQGYLFSRPVDGEAIGALLAAQR